MSTIRGISRLNHVRGGCLSLRLLGVTVDQVMKNVSQAGPDDIFEARVCFLCSLELFPVRDPREAA